MPQDTAPPAASRMPQADPQDASLSGLLAARYGDQPGAGPQGLEDGSRAVLEQLLAHRSHRAYLDRPLPQGALGLAVAAAQSASTSSNLQAWSVVEVSDPALKSEINALSGNQRQIDEAPVLLVWLADLGRLRRISDHEGGEGTALDYTECLLIGVIDAALAAQNALVALEAQGLGGCFIGGIRNNADRVAALLGLPPEVLPVFGLTVGVPDPARPARIKPRLPAGSVLHRNSYDAAQADAGLPGYEAALGRFQQAEGLPPSRWRKTVAKRIGSIASLHGRDRMVGFLRSLGFGMK